MANSLSYRITAISMALLLLLSSTGFSMDMHFCQSHLSGISFLGKAKSCHEMQSSSSCQKKKMDCNHKENATQDKKDNCCQNNSIVIEKSDVDATITPVATVQDIQSKFVAALLAVYVFNYSVEVDFQSYELYKPPLPDRDILVFYQTFLI